MIVARAILADLEGRVLLLQRSDTVTHSPGRFSLPGGKVEPGQSLNDTCIREVLEETGLVIHSLTP